jgi:IS1 family transposase
MDSATRSRPVGSAKYTSLKKCPQCTNLKTRDQFYRDRGNPDGLDRLCKPHRIKATSRYHKNNRDKQRIWSAKNRIKNKVIFKVTGKPPKKHPRKRICPKCTHKRFDVEFQVNSLRSSGRDSWCIYCVAPYRRWKSRRWYNSSKGYVKNIRDPQRRLRIAQSPYLHGRELAMHRLRSGFYELRVKNL